MIIYSSVLQVIIKLWVSIDWMKPAVLAAVESEWCSEGLACRRARKDCILIDIIMTTF